MTSRLDRLFILLESGSAPITRKAAAKQIGEVQKLHPHELHNLLNRLITYLHSTNWDTRIAASQAVQAILENVPQWTPPSDGKVGNSTDCVVALSNPCNSDLTRLSFDKFDLENVLSKGAHLMGSEGKEFDLAEEVEGSSIDERERLAKQRELLNEKLGLNQAKSLGIHVEDLVTLDDMKIQPITPSKSTSNSTNLRPCPPLRLLPVQEILTMDMSSTPTHNSPSPSPASTSSALSCREMNRARRKARQQNSVVATPSPSISGSARLSRSNSTAGSNGGSAFNFDDNQQPDKKKPKLIEQNGKSEPVVSTNEPTPDVTGAWNDSVVDWPLESFCSKLYLDLFSTRWEIRHGSATALRELLKTHSQGAGKSIYMTSQEMEHQHQMWLEDAALRLLCVLALDRFGDFVSDQVVAPVRETCAQVLGTVLKNMPVIKMFPTIKILLKFVKQQEWEVRHGGLLGIKYMLVVREDLLQTILPLIINDVLTGLFDPVDDVGAVSATTLIPIATFLPKLLNSSQVSQIVKMLWDLLLDQDELTSACNSFMGLLAAILSLPDASQWIQMEPMSVLIPRLWPFLSHSTSSVRRSTLQTLLTLTKNQTKSKAETPDLGFSQNNDNCDIKLPLVTGTITTTTSTTDNLVLNFGVKDWPPQLLQEALRHIFQRVLVEHVPDIQQLVEHVWNNLVNSANLSALLHAACPYVACWLCLAMQPSRLGFDPAHLINYKPIQNKERKHRTFDLLDNHVAVQQKLYLGGTETVPVEQREKNITRARFMACKMIGLLSRYLVMPAPDVVYTPDIESPIDCYAKVLLGYLSSRSSLQRLISGMVIAFWAENDSTIQPGPPQIQEKLKQCLVEYTYYDEVAVFFTRLVQESRDFLATLKQHKINVTEFENCAVLTLDQINTLCTTMHSDQLKTKYNLKPKIFELLEDRRRGLFQSYTTTNYEQNTLNIATQAALAGAVVNLKCLPEKLNPIVKPLMESIKREESEILQKMAARFLTRLLNQIVDRQPCPNNKIVSNLCALLKSDADFTPKIYRDGELKGNDDDQYLGILTLVNQQKAKDLNGGATVASRGPGRPPLVDLASTEDSNEASSSEDPMRKQCRIQRLGATHAITSICSYFDKDLPQKIPILWQILFEQISKIDDAYVLSIAKHGGAVVNGSGSSSTNFVDDSKTNDLITALQTIEIAAPHLSVKLHDNLFEILPKLCVLLKHPLKAIRHMVSRCLAKLASINSSKVMILVMNDVLPLLDQSVKDRQGAAETIACIVNELTIRIVPYVVLLVVPLLGRMSDSDRSVRLMSTHCFALLIQLMPLDGTIPDAGELSEELKIRKMKDREFLEYLFSPKTIPNFDVPVKINAELRSYQQAGINWLWFLNKYKLHGILCDDMGLGKTIQTICILAGDHYIRQKEKQAKLPSIVICPPTLTGHWVFEVNKFLSNNYLAPLHYVGLPTDREKLRSKIKNHQLVVASYDIVRKDIDFFSSIQWNYCVLDEGHVIKNGKTKSSKAIKLLIANHRLILSGTPIQNNVLELWSLFDFLMPGFLGTEKQFMTKFSKPILASRDAKSSAKDQEAGALAMESLHRQVLPFLLRRVKEDVLTDLPPKILADMFCELSPLQERLYEDFSKTHLKADIRDCLENIDGNNVNKKTHVFQALRYLQNVCNHPKLVLTPHHPEFRSIIGELLKKNTSLDDIEHSAKLPALKQLLLDCGIGTNCDEMVSVNQHRALIFCQLKAMLDIIENDLLKKHLPSVSFLRLDGSVPASSRHHIVTKFNNDPSIDVLLLTTQVGGLGLNLTGADTVIFVEHDWNPMKDLQAMDRAHRIGQKKVVNVYRLITRKSLEEKIMGLQKFKLLTANTIVSDENASMETMGTDNLLDLFNLTEESKAKGRQQDGGGASTSSSSVKNVLENLPELWDNNQYEDEYDLTQFLEGLKK